MLGSLFIARLFSPAEYGEFAIWLGVVAVSAVVITGRYEMALAIEPDGKLRRIATQTTLFVVLSGGFILVAITVLAGAYELVSSLSPLMLWILGPAAAATAASQTCQACVAANGNYRDLGIIRISQAGAITLAQISVGLFDSSAHGLGIAYLGGVTLGVLVALSRLQLRLGWAAPFRLPSAAQDFLVRHRKFPLLALPADTVNTAAAQLPLIIVAYRFGAEVAGLLALTLRMVGAPIGLLGASVLDVFRRRSARSFSERGECRAEYIDTFRVLAFGSCIVAIALTWLAEPVFSLAFGDPWRMSGTMAAWLMPMFALRFVASPLSFLFYVAGKQQLDLMWQLSLLATTVTSLWLPGNSELAIKAYGLGYSVLYCIYLATSYRLSKGLGL